MEIARVYKKMKLNNEINKILLKMKM